jgi:hypothetical protein
MGALKQPTPAFIAITNSAEDSRVLDAAWTAIGAAVCAQTLICVLHPQQILPGSADGLAVLPGSHQAHALHPPNCRIAQQSPRLLRRPPPQAGHALHLRFDGGYVVLPASHQFQKERIG